MFCGNRNLDTHLELGIKGFRIVIRCVSNLIFKVHSLTES